jgi:hypothetical protein
MGLAHVAAVTGRPQEATTLLRQAVSVARELASEREGGSSQDLGRAYLALGRQLQRNGDTAEAGPLLAEAARILEGAGDPGAQEAMALMARTAPER